MSLGAPDSEAPVPAGLEGLPADRASVPAVRPPRLTHVRAAAILLVLTILFTGFGYTGVVYGIAQLVVPATANGSLLYGPNGTVVGSSLIAQNLSAPWLFWERPSLTDYNSFNGSPTLYGPSDPALVNETRSYILQYGFGTVNASVPFLLVSDSASGLDPDLTPEAVLFQVPRVAASSNLSEAALQALVNEHTVPPLGGFIGMAYVDVLQLDLALLPLEHRSL